MTEIFKRSSSNSFPPLTETLCFHLKSEMYPCVAKQPVIILSEGTLWNEYLHSDNVSTMSLSVNTLHQCSLRFSVLLFPGNYLKFYLCFHWMKFIG